MTVFYSDTFAAAIAASTIDLSQQRLYAVLLEGIPLRSYATRSQLDEPENAQYAVQPVSHTWASNLLTITSNPVFPQHSDGLDLATHVALCYRAGATPASTDMFCWASSLRELSQLIAAPASLQFAPLQARFPSTPIINFAVNFPVFPGGTHNTPLLNTTQGIIARLGLNNYTTGTFTNPVGTAVASTTKVMAYNGSVVVTNLANIGRRVIASTSLSPIFNTNNQVMVLDFFGGDGSLSRNILASRIAFNIHQNSAGVANLQFAVGSSVPALTAANFSNDAYFTSIADYAPAAGAVSLDQMINTTASSYERFLRLKYTIVSGTPSFSMSLLEFFDPSRLQSPNTTL